MQHKFETSFMRYITSRPLNESVALRCGFLFHANSAAAARQGGAVKIDTFLCLSLIVALAPIKEDLPDDVARM